MTYREKYRLEHPDGSADLIHVFLCPLGLERGIWCSAPSCRACWDREIEEVTEDANETMPH